MLFGVNSAAAAAMLSKRETSTRTTQGISDLSTERQKGSMNIENSRATDTQRWTGDKIIMGTDYLGRTIRDRGESGSTRSVIGAATEVGGGAIGLHEQYRSIQHRASGQQLALDLSTEGMITNRQQAARGHYGNQDQYFQEMSENLQQYAAGQTAAANAAAGQAAGGVNRGAAIQMGGINRGTALEMQGNQVRFDAQVKAADFNRGAAIQAAKLQALSNVMSTVGRAIAKDIEHGMSQRY